ncbi:MAG: 4-amino-4-deoxy-L-arabinose transferase, partial [uncultured bacterium]
MKHKIVQFFRSKYFEYILLSIILITGFGVRLYKIENPIADWHSWRQADTASVSKIYAEKGVDLLLPRYHDISKIQSGIFNPEGYRMVEFPFFNALNAVLFNSFPTLSLEVWARLITITCALVTSFFLYLIAKRILNKWAGILAAFFYLFIPYNIYFTRVILPDPMGVMFGIISIWAFLEFTYSNKKLLLLFSSVFFAMALLIKPYIGFYFFPIIYLAVRKYGIKSFFKNKSLIIGTIIYLLIMFTPFFIWRWWEAGFPEGIPFYKWAFNGNLIRLKPSWWYWIFGERLGHLILGSLGLIPFTFGLLNTKVKNNFIHAFLAGVLFYLVAVANANVMHDYYQILTIPA